jgi:hypothetical protein
MSTEIPAPTGLHTAIFKNGNRGTVLQAETFWSYKGKYGETYNWDTPTQKELEDYFVEEERLHKDYPSNYPKKPNRNVSIAKR